MKRMTIVTNKYTLGLIAVVLFAVMLYLGYVGLASYNATIAVGTITEQEDEELSWLNEDDVNLNNISNSAAFFIEYRLDRDRTRGQQLELLRKIIDDANSGAEALQEAQEKIIQITNSLEKELHLESLIKAKGFEDAVTFIKPQSVTTVIDQEEFSRDEIVRITDLVMTVTGQNIENIFIIPNRGEKQ